MVLFLLLTIFLLTIFLLTSNDLELKEYDPGLGLSDDGVGVEFGSFLFA
jgi:hypothetical protein